MSMLELQKLNHFGLTLKSIKSAGRPRSIEVDDAILRAATSLFYHHPYPAVSMELISQKAAVSKATLYRRWPNKATLAVAVLVKAMLAQTREFKDLTYRQHLTANLKALRDMLGSPYATMIASLIAEAQQDKTLQLQLHEQLLKPMQAVGDSDLAEAIRRGEIKSSVDNDLLFDQVFGFFYYRMLVVGKEITDSDIDNIVDAFFVVSAAG